MKLILMFLTIFFNCGIAVLAQPQFPENGELFSTVEIPEFHLTIPPDSLNKLLLWENRFQNHEYETHCVFQTNKNTYTFEKVGLRLRGNTSRNAQKKSFRISLNTFVKGQKLEKVEKINLVALHNDPSISRSQLCFDFLRFLEIPASRSNHVKLYINKEFMGIYVNTEHYDEEFTKSRWGTQGNLYKCTYGANLNYLGKNESFYQLPYYELHKSRNSNDYVDLAHFIDVLNNSSNSDFKCEIEKVFNVHTYLKAMVFDLLVGNWDGPLYNKNNFYLYQNPQTNQFEYIPYDLDNTFGIDWLNQDWGRRNIYKWSNSNENLPLYSRIMSHYRDEFNYFLKFALDSFFNESVLEPKLNYYKSLISEAAILDTYRIKDYGFSNSDFEQAFTSFSRGHVKYGLLDFVTTRRGSISNSEIQFDLKSIPIWHHSSINYSDNKINFTLKTTRDSSLKKVMVRYFYANDIEKTEVISTNSKTSFWEVSIPINTKFENTNFQFILIEDTDTSYYPSCADYFSLQIKNNSILLYINELMASNDKTIRAPNGGYEDWFEFYNNGAQSINLDGYYVTDDINNPFKHRLSNLEIKKDSFLLLWADGLPHLGNSHLDFKLSKDGEDLAIFDPNGRLIDMVVFGAQRSDISYGRSVDGGAFWVPFFSPTPGFSNHKKANISKVKNDLLIYPNPAINLLIIQTQNVIIQWEIQSISGLQLKKGLGIEVDINHLHQGLYLLLVNTSEGQFIHKFIKK